VANAEALGAAPILNLGALHKRLYNPARQRLICPAMFSGALREFRSRLADSSGDGRGSRYGYRDVLGIFQRKFSELHDDLLDAESFKQMRCQPIGERLDQICRLISHKILRFLRNDRIIDGVVDLVRHIALLVIWPERNADGQSLRGRTFFLRNPDVRENFELLDMNPVRKRIWFVGHPARLPRYRLEQHRFDGNAASTSVRVRRRFFQSAGRRAMDPKTAAALIDHS
jgi:hypothetical protein